MLLRSDFNKRAIVTPGDYHWITSPQSGVQRMMLDRVGDEVARATSIVRYAEGSHFPSHRHPGGEEILVLTGTFSEGTNHYPAGWYMRNPPGSAHEPSSDFGTTIFVKLCQMSDGDRDIVRIDTRNPSNWLRSRGRHVCVLFANGTERVTLERLSPHQDLNRSAEGGAEILVVEGTLLNESTTYEQGSWMRLPPADTLHLRSGPSGAVVYMKTGHLSAPVSCT